MQLEKQKVDFRTYSLTGYHWFKRKRLLNGDSVYWNLLIIYLKNHCLTSLLCIACVSVAFGTFSEQVLSSPFFLIK